MHVCVCGGGGGERERDAGSRQYMHVIPVMGRGEKKSGEEMRERMNSRTKWREGGIEL